MINIQYFESIIEAELAHNLLKEHGIESYVEKRGVQFPGDLGDSYGANIFVANKDADKTKEILQILNEETKQ